MLLSQITHTAAVKASKTDSRLRGRTSRCIWRDIWAFQRVHTGFEMGLSKLPQYFTDRLATKCYARSMLRGVCNATASLGWHTNSWNTWLSYNRKHCSAWLSSKQICGRITSRHNSLYHNTWILNSNVPIPMHSWLEMSLVSRRLVSPPPFNTHWNIGPIRWKPTGTEPEYVHGFPENQY